MDFEVLIKAEFVFNETCYYYIVLMFRAILVEEILAEMAKTVNKYQWFCYIVTRQLRQIDILSYLLE